MSKSHIPIAAARRMGQDHDCPVVVVFAIEPGGERFTVTTWGNTKSLCRLAADYGKKLSEAIMSGIQEATLMTTAERAEVKRAIRFYERRGWDWSLVVEFLVRQAHGSLPHDELRAWWRTRRRRKS